MEQSDQARETRVRKEATKQGYSIKKSRVTQTTGDNYGGYMIVNANTNSIECGARFDLSLDDVEKFVNEK